ncbi:hypothetical protein [Burkholderia ubonensis]|nr:hypothetical protein [Burkholderia ubonensis]
MKWNIVGRDPATRTARDASIRQYARVSKWRDAPARLARVPSVK